MHRRNELTLALLAEEVSLTGKERSQFRVAQASLTLGVARKGNRYRFDTLDERSIQ